MMAWNLATLGAWTPAHLYAAAPFAASQAPMWMEHFEGYRDRLAAMESWEGAAKEGAWESAAWNAQTAQMAAYPASEGAATLTDIAGAAEYVHGLVLGQVGAATADGFVVDPDLTKVSDPAGTVYPNAQVAQQRQKMAQDHAGMIKHYLGQFQDTLDTGARRIQAHSDELNGVGFPDGVKVTGGHSDPHVQAMDVTPDWPTPTPGQGAVPRFPFPMPPTDPPARPWPAPGDKFYPWPGTPPGDSTNWPNPATDFQGTNHGGNFNPGITIDRSHATSTGPEAPDDGWRSGFTGDQGGVMGGGGRFAVGQSGLKTDTPTAPQPGAPSSGRIQAVDDKVCDDPNYNTDIERRLAGSMATGALLGGLTAGVPGAIIGGATAGIADIIHETQGDGPKCK